MKQALLLSAFMISLFTEINGQQFSQSEKQFILSGDTATMMRVLINTNTADIEILGSESSDIDPGDPLLPLLARRMFLSMRDTANPGVGIAAPQVGISRNTFWLQRFDKPDQPFEFFINPTIIKYSGLLRYGEEGCLSIPDERGEVMRSYAIMVEYQSFDMGWHTEMLEDFTAVIFQHEYDHLRGKLFTGRIREQESSVFVPVPQGIGFFIKTETEE